MKEREKRTGACSVVGEELHASPKFQSGPDTKMNIVLLFLDFSKSHVH